MANGLRCLRAVAFAPALAASTAAIARVRAPAAAATVVARGRERQPLPLRLPAYKDGRLCRCDDLVSRERPSRRCRCSGPRARAAAAVAANLEAHLDANLNASHKDDDVRWAGSSLGQSRAAARPIDERARMARLRARGAFARRVRAGTRRGN